MTDSLKPYPRAEGGEPEIVRKGRPELGSVVIFDPAGAASHGELPASWREMTEHRMVLWCRLPGDSALSEACEQLSDRDVVPAPVDVVTSGPSAGTVMDVLASTAGAIRSVLLVDPAAGDPEQDAVISAAAADARWEAANEARRAALEAEGVFVDVISHSGCGERDRIAPPLPLGHPDVVAAVEKTLRQLDTAG